MTLTREAGALFETDQALFETVQAAILEALAAVGKPAFRRVEVFRDVYARGWNVHYEMPGEDGIRGFFIGESLLNDCYRCLHPTEELKRFVRRAVEQELRREQRAGFPKEYDFVAELKLRIKGKTAGVDAETAQRELLEHPDDLLDGNVFDIVVVRSAAVLTPAGGEAKKGS